MKKPIIYLPSLLPWLAVLLGVCLTVLVFYPGYMSLDSFEQLTQARSGVYFSAHPPLMSWVWSFIDKVIPGPLGMVIIFALVFWVGLGLFVTVRIAKPVFAAVVILFVGLFPSVFALLGTVWKDVGMGAALVLSAGLIARASQSKNLYVLACSLPFLFFAYSASAILYAAIHFFILSARDFRYHWWTVLSDFLCLIVFLSGVSRKKSVPPSPAFPAF